MRKSDNILAEVRDLKEESIRNIRKLLIAKGADEENPIVIDAFETEEGDEVQQVYLEEGQPCVITANVDGTSLVSNLNVLDVIAIQSILE